MDSWKCPPHPSKTSHEKAGSTARNMGTDCEGSLSAPLGARACLPAERWAHEGPGQAEPLPQDRHGQELVLENSLAGDELWEQALCLSHLSSWCSPAIHELHGFGQAPGPPTLHPVLLLVPTISTEFVKENSSPCPTENVVRMMWCCVVSVPFLGGLCRGQTARAELPAGFCTHTCTSTLTNTCAHRRRQDLRTYFPCCLLI